MSAPNAPVSDKEDFRVVPALWQELPTQGFTGSERTVRRAVRSWRLSAPDPSTPAPDTRASSCIAPSGVLVVAVNAWFLV